MPEEVDPVSPPPPKTSSPEVKKPINWKNILMGAVIGAVLVGVGTLVFYLYQGKSKETTSTQVTTTKTSTPSAKTSTPSAAIDETANWKTFKGDVIEYPPGNGNVKVTLKFPVPYETSNYEGVSRVSSKNQTELVPSKVGDIQVQTSLYPKDSGQPDALYPPKDGSDSKLDGKTAQRFISDKNVVSYVVKNLTSNAYTFIFTCIYIPKPGDNAEETCNLIASTFKFLD